jgi:hypothetical protein
MIVDGPLRRGQIKGIGIVALVGQQRLDPVGDHAEQGTKALDVVRLPRRQDKAERAALASHRAWSLVVKPPRDRPSVSVC